MKAVVFSIILVLAVSLYAEPVAVDRPGRVTKADILHGHRVNINTESIDSLMMIPHVGEIRAGEIVATRDSLGGRFGSVEELVLVKGIKAKMLDKIRPYITCK